MRSAKNIKEFFRGNTTVIFSDSDHVSDQYFRGKFGLDYQELPHHVIPSSSDLYSFIKSGLGYGVVPLLHAEKDLNAGRLYLLSPGHEVRVTYYVHYWRFGTIAYRSLLDELRKGAQRLDHQNTTKS